MNAVATPSCLPVQITDRRRSGLLVIEWDDGALSLLQHGRLRQQCRCAACTQRRRNGELPAPPSALADIRPVADKGLNLVFADGHDRGIYPWAYLRELGDGRA